MDDGYNPNLCSARRWNDGYIGEHNGVQCQNEIHKKLLCKYHYKKYKICKMFNCIRGISGLGACNNIDDHNCRRCHKGLWLGTVLNEIPEYNDLGEHVIVWKDKTPKKKSKKIKTKTMLCKNNFNRTSQEKEIPIVKKKNKKIKINRLKKTPTVEKKNKKIVIKRLRKSTIKPQKKIRIHKPKPKLTKPSKLKKFTKNTIKKMIFHYLDSIDLYNSKLTSTDSVLTKMEGKIGYTLQSKRGVVAELIEEFFKNKLQGELDSDEEEKEIDFVDCIKHEFKNGTYYVDYETYKAYKGSVNNLKYVGIYLPNGTVKLLQDI